MRLLILENEDDMRVLLRHTFELEGCEVTTAGCCKEALEALKCTDFDLAIVDLGLPVVDGISCGEKLKFKCPEMTMFAHTAYLKHDKPDRVLVEAGFDRCFRKGDDPEKLIKAVLNLGKERGDAARRE